MPEHFRSEGNFSDADGGDAESDFGLDEEGEDAESDFGLAFLFEECNDAAVCISDEEAGDTESDFGLEMLFEGNNNAVEFSSGTHEIVPETFDEDSHQTVVEIPGEESTAQTTHWIAVIFISGMLIVERVVYTSISSSVGMFMISIMHQPFTSSAIGVSVYVAITSASQILGSIVADECLGPHWTMFISSSISSLGLVGLAIVATASPFMPHQQDCDFSTIPSHSCEGATKWQMTILYVFLIILAMGSAGRACASSYRDHQFDDRTKEKMRLLNDFCIALGVLLSAFLMTIQLTLGWKYFFEFLAILMGVCDLLFMGSKYFHRYRLKKPAHNPAIQLILAASGRSVFGGQIVNEAARNDMRCLRKLLLIAACVVFLNVISTKSLTLSILQASTMMAHIGRLEIPVTIFSMFPSLLNIFPLLFYHFMVSPLLRYISGHDVSTLWRIGIGLVASTVSLGFAALFEFIRRNYAIRNGYQASYLTLMPNFSALWLIVQYLLFSIAEVFCIVVGLSKLIDEEVPNVKGMSDMYVSLVQTLGAMVAVATRFSIKIISNYWRKKSWLNENINVGRYDCIHLIYCIVSVIILIVFMHLANRYKYWTQQGST